MSSGYLVNLGIEVLEYLVHCFGMGALTQSGSQYGTTVLATSSDAAEYTVIDSATIQPFSYTKPGVKGAGKTYGMQGDILEMEFGLTAAFKTLTDATAICTYKWQAKDASVSSTCWVDLNTWNTTAVGLTYTDFTYSGYKKIETNLEKFPINVRLIMFNGTATGTTEQASAKTKNASYVRVLYRVQ